MIDVQVVGIHMKKPSDMFDLAVPALFYQMA